MTSNNSIIRINEKESNNFLELNILEFEDINLNNENNNNGMKSNSSINNILNYNNGIESSINSLELINNSEIIDIEHNIINNNINNNINNDTIFYDLNNNNNNNINNNNNNNNNNNSNSNNNNNNIINEKNYIFGIKFNYPEYDNIVLIKKKENGFFWKWNNSYPENLRDYISKEDFLKDIEILNGLKRYYIFVLSLYSFWLLFFLVMIFVGLYPKLNPIIIGMFAPFFGFSIINIGWQIYKKKITFKNYCSNKLSQINLKYRDVNIQWRLVSKKFINFYRIEKEKNWIEINLPEYPLKLIESYPSYSNIQISTLNCNENLNI